MSLSTPLEQTYLKVPCSRCGQVTPHRDNSTTTQCEVCYTSNFPLSVKTEYYTGWELAFFWQARYRSVVGYGAPVAATAVAGPSNQYPVTVGGVTHWLNPEPQRVQYAGIPVPTGTVMLAEPIAGGMIVSKADPYPTEADKVGYPDFTSPEYIAQKKIDAKEWEERAKDFQNKFVDPNSIGTL